MPGTSWDMMVVLMMDCTLHDAMQVLLGTCMTLLVLLQERCFSRQMRRQSQAQQKQSCSSTATEDLSQQGQLFPAWLTQQVNAPYCPCRGLPCGQCEHN